MYNVAPPFCPLPHLSPSEGSFACRGLVGFTNAAATSTLREELMLRWRRHEWPLFSGATLSNYVCDHPTFKLPYVRLRYDSPHLAREEISRYRRASVAQRFRVTRRVRKGGIEGRMNEGRIQIIDALHGRSIL